MKRLQFHLNAAHRTLKRERGFMHPAAIYGGRIKQKPQVQLVAVESRDSSKICGQFPYQSQIGEHE